MLPGLEKHGILRDRKRVWGATIMLSGLATTMMAGGEGLKAAPDWWGFKMAGSDLHENSAQCQEPGSPINRYTFT